MNENWALFLKGNAYSYLYFMDWFVYSGLRMEFQQLNKFGDRPILIFKITVIDFFLVLDV